MRELEDALARMRNAWMAGRPALEHCPIAWRGAIGDGPAAEAALAAFAGQAAQIAFRPAPAAALVPRLPLPKLRLPVLPDPLRPRARRVMAIEKGAATIVELLLCLLEARGFAVHPADWLPQPRDDWAPDLYASWLDWVSAETRAPPNAAISAETYGDWPWAERRKAVQELRRRDPAAARAIIAAKAATESAERRVKLVEILETALSDSDATFLESLASDRSDRVKEMARHYLARLGKGGDSSPLEAELAEMVAFAKTARIVGRRQLNLKKLKTAPMNARRRDLFGLVSLGGLARALGVAEMQLVETMPVGEADGIAAFIGMLAATGSVPARRALLDHVIGDRSCPLAHAAPLAARLAAEERREILAAVIAADDDSFVFSRQFAGPVLGEVPMKIVASTDGFRVVLEALETARTGEDAQRTAAERALAASLLNLGFLLDARGAAELLGMAVAAGLSSADPKLELLHLNAALKPETSP